MKIKHILIGLGILVGCTVPASADPVITPIVTSFLVADVGIGAATAGVISSLLVGAAISTGLSYRSLRIFPSGRGGEHGGLA